VTNPKLRDGSAAERAARTAVLSPVGAGCTWVILVYANVMTEPRETLGERLDSAMAAGGVFAFGLLGLSFLSVPLVIGVTATSRSTALAAAWAGAAVAALAGGWWLLAEPIGSVKWLTLVSSAVMFSPLLVTASASRSPAE
jgi:hypothetical protein